MALSKKQRIFIEVYLQCWNATKAATKAEYANPRQAGSRLLSNVDIKDLIEKRIKQAAMSADEVLHRLAEQARADYSEYITDAGDIDIEALLADGKGHLIKKTHYDKDGNLVVDFYDAQRALVHLGRHHQLFTDKVDITSDGQPIKTYITVSPDDWDTDDQGDTGDTGQAGAF